MLTKAFTAGAFWEEERAASGFFLSLVLCQTPLWIKKLSTPSYTTIMNEKLEILQLLWKEHWKYLVSENDGLHKMLADRIHRTDRPTPAAHEDLLGPAFVSPWVSSQIKHHVLMPLKRIDAEILESTATFRGIRHSNCSDCGSMEFFWWTQ